MGTFRAVIDKTKIDELHQFDMDNHDDLLPELCTVFRKIAPERVVEMGHSLDTEDWPTLAREAHTLKSSAGNLGASRLEALCRSIETRVPLRSRGELRDLIRAAREELTGVIQELSLILEQRYGRIE